jgi:isopenicillin-N epimerase
MITPRPAPSPHRHLWGLDPDIIYLNHGAYGACPLAVRRQQDEWRDRAQRNPSEAFGFERPRLLAEARAALGQFVGARPEQLAFVPRAVTAAHAVLRLLRLSQGDQVLVTDHAFHATRAAVDATAAAAGAKVVVASIPFPIASPAEVTSAIFARATNRTRLIVVDHVVSQTALVFPVAEIVRAAAARGVAVLVDGAHAAGQVPLQLDTLGAAFAVGNTHKWIGSPPSAGFVYVRRDLLPGLVGGARLEEALAWLLPHDPTPFLGIPAAIDHLGAVQPGGWPALMAHNHALALRGRELLCAALGVAAPCPAEMVGAMAAIPLPGAPDPAKPIDPLQAALFERERITAPIMRSPDGRRRLLRISAQLYNTEDEYDLLARALVALLH